MEYRISGNEQNLHPILTESMYMETQVATALGLTEIDF
jgi:hypothetical protein